MSDFYYPKNYERLKVRKKENYFREQIGCKKLASVWINPKVYIMKAKTINSNCWTKQIKTELKSCRKVQPISKRYKMS